MRRSIVYVLSLALVFVIVVAGAFYVLHEPPLRVDEILADYRQGAAYEKLTIHYPLDETLFPPEIVPPTFRWSDENTSSDAWIVAVDFQDNQGRMSFSCDKTQWKPSAEQWEAIKRRSLEKPATVTILGVNRRAGKICSAASISISTSKDEVGAPLFYREVNLPFIDAWKDPASHIRWRFGSISSPEPPPIVLEKVPNCANCHSFTADGSILAMEVDSANDKGSYVIAPVEEEIVFDPPKIITWSDYRREDNEPTFGLLPQISPDGKYVICMVKDQSVFVAKPGLAFSQLFFPIKGILVYYNLETRTFHALPGADDRRFVHANPTWSPDGKYIVFARAKVRELKQVHDVRSRKTTSRQALLTRAECEQFLKEVGTFQYDLYRIPFNNGRGGKAEPLEGASNNGMSNYFPKYSPDGKWIVFCKAKSFMLLQPDSQLWIIPAEGGKAHTQLFLTHIDEQGRSTPPVLLDNMTEPGRAANIPEFVNLQPDAIKKIHPRYLDDTYYVRAGGEFRRQLDYENAIRWYQKALAINPKNVEALVQLGDCLVRQRKFSEAKPYFTQAIEIDPKSRRGHEGLGNVLAEEGKFSEAVAHFRAALRIDPRFAIAHFRLGVLLMDTGNREEAKLHLAEAIRLDREDPRAACALAAALASEGKLQEAAELYRLALGIDPDLPMALTELAAILTTTEDPNLRNGQEALQLAKRACKVTGNQNPAALLVLSQAYAEVGQFGDAIDAAEEALKIVLANGNEEAARVVRERIELYRREMLSSEAASR